MLALYAHLVTVGDKRVDLLLSIGFSIPLPLVLEKESEGTRAQFAST